MAKKVNIRELVYNKYNSRCAYCVCEIEQNKFTIDHIVPLRRGDNNDFLQKYNLERGSNKLENLNPCCLSCNSSKSTFTIEQWRIQLTNKINVVRNESSGFRILERFGMVKIVTDKVTFYFESEVKNG